MLDNGVDCDMNILYDEAVTKTAEYSSSKARQMTDDMIDVV